MGERLLSVGLDVGTSTTSLILSALTVENAAAGFAVPRLEIAEREVLYRSAVHMTPLLGQELVDGEGVRTIVEEEYRLAGIQKRQVDTGAIIITGETSRKENAAAVLAALSEFAGEFVVATAGPDLESVLAAKGAGAVEYSQRTGRRVVHIDIGGGTSNFARIEDGSILATACMNVGGRLIKLEDGKISYLSPVLAGLIDLELGQVLTEERGLTLARLLASALEMAVGLREKTALFDKLTTAGTRPLPIVEGAVVSFSGGVAACMEKTAVWDAYGDLGPLLARAILESRLCKGEYRLGAETVFSTVIGAGCHSTQLSGSTVYCRHVSLPLKNLPVVRQPGQEGILYLEGKASPTYDYVTALADQIAADLGDKPCYIALQADMAKALGGALALRLGKDRPILCIDSVAASEGCYLDIGKPVGPALPVVVKTLAFEKMDN